MPDPSSTLTLTAAFLTGIAGSAHCFAMCGGIAGALGMHAKAAGALSSSVAVASSYQLGRIAGYAAAGAIVGFIGAQASRLLDFAQAAWVLRIASAVFVALLGLRLLFRWNALAWIEQLGARFWMKLRPLVQLAGKRTGAARPLALGMLWSLLPCGLIYSMLMLAAMSADPARGALIMLAFGAGTLPSMLSTSLLAARLQTHMSRPAVRFGSGLSMLVLGVWMLVATAGMHAHTEAHPILHPAEVGDAPGRHEHH